MQEQAANMNADPTVGILEAGYGAAKNGSSPTFHPSSSEGDGSPDTINSRNDSKPVSLEQSSEKLAHEPTEDTSEADDETETSALPVQHRPRKLEVAEILKATQTD